MTDRRKTDMSDNVHLALDVGLDWANHSE